MGGKPDALQAKQNTLAGLGLFSLPLDTFCNVDGPSQAVKHNLWLGKSPRCRFFWRWEKRQGKPPCPCIHGIMEWFRLKGTLKSSISTPWAGILSTMPGSSKLQCPTRPWALPGFIPAISQVWARWIVITSHNCSAFSTARAVHL